MEITTILIISLIVIIIVLIFIIAASEEKRKNIVQEYEMTINTERKNAIKQSKSVIRGQVTEQMVPIFGEFPYNVQDCKFLGQPVDYIVFENMSKIREGEDLPLTIILSDVKFNTASKTKIQKAIKEAILKGNIKFEEWRVNDENKLNIK